MFLKDFDFNLPPELIAQYPCSPKDHSKLLVYDKRLSHHVFFELPNLLKAGDLLVLNNTKVIWARLLGHSEKKEPIEIFLLKPTSDGFWECMVKPGKKIKTFPFSVYFKEHEAKILSTDGKHFKVQIDFDPNTVGTVPLPPYIKRLATEKDKTDYQTVYAKTLGSVAAPTAGLHFTEKTFKDLKDKNIEIAEVTLNVGYGTFSPVREEVIENHKMHSEKYFIPDETLEKIQETKKRGGRVIAVGTTALRTLESYLVYGANAETDIFIMPGYKPKMVDGLVTNFHLPKSSLFILVSSLIGIPQAQALYQSAIENKYRFFSYGDASLLMWC